MSAMKNKLVVNGGFANRMNGVLSNLDSTIIWPIDDQCGAGWDDLFLTKHDVVSEPDNTAGHACTMFNGNATKAREFLSVMLPSDEVRARMPYLPPIKVGWHVRALYPGSMFGRYLPIYQDHFLATDSTAIRQQYSRCVMQKDVPVTTHDKAVRTREHVICAVADWFTLLQCQLVYSVGVPFVSYSLKHSTFLDARRIMCLKTLDFG